MVPRAVERDMLVRWDGAYVAYVPRPAPPGWRAAWQRTFGAPTWINIRGLRGPVSIGDLLIEGVVLASFPPVVAACSVLVAWAGLSLSFWLFGAAVAVIYGPVALFIRSALSSWLSPGAWVLRIGGTLEVDGIPAGIAALHDEQVLLTDGRAVSLRRVPRRARDWLHEQLLSHAPKP